VVEHGIDPGSDGHGHALTETSERTATVGGIAHDVDIAIGEVFGDHVEQVAGQFRFRGTALDRRRGQDRKRHRV
jgi:hypothetical protein